MTQSRCSGRVGLQQLHPVAQRRVEGGSQQTLQLDPRLSVGLAVQHISNAGIKQPNGGINLYMLTASYRL